MRPRTVVVRHVLPQDPPQAPLIDDYHMVQTLPAQRAYHPFRNGVRPGRLDRGKNGLDTDLACLCLEALSIAAVPITNQVSGCPPQGVAWISWRHTGLHHEYG